MGIDVHPIIKRLRFLESKAYFIFCLYIIEEDLL